LSTSAPVEKASEHSPLDEVARQQIMGRLQEATALAEGDLARELGPFQEMLQELLERSQALEVARNAIPGAGPVCDRYVANVLACSELTGQPGGPVREFLLIPFGEVKVERPCAGGSFVFTPAQAESARRWFEGIGRKLAIDYEHQSFDRFNTRADGLRPAAGWIGGLEVREDGLWATEITWTERAAELLRSGEYRYFSPVIFWTDEDQSDVAGLGPVALTNDPAMRGVMPLAAKRAGGVEEDGAKDEQEGPVPPAESQARMADDLAAAREEISLLRRQLAIQAADAFVERGMRLGKIVDATSMDWRQEYMRDPELAEQRLALAAVVLPPGRVLPLDRRGQVEPQQVKQTTSDMGGHLAIAAEDLEAYERAVLTGRVLRPASGR
jgi:hypothetical protein